MKPKTAEQKKVWGMYLRLSKQPVSKARLQYMKDDAWKGLYHKGYKEHVRCLHCGAMLKMDPGSAKGKVCSRCGNRFKEDLYMPKSRKLDLWLLSIEVHFGYQVFRKFVVTRYFGKDGIDFEDVTEVNQNWMRKDGEITSICRKLNYMNWNQTYVLYSDMEVRGSYGQHNNWYYDILPGMRHIPEIRDMLWSQELRRKCNMTMIEYASSILKSRYAETIFKILGREAYITYMTRPIHEHCWRLALRYLWKPGNWSDWEDHIRNLEYLGLDTHNPKMVVPENFDAEHTRINILVNKKREKERERRRREDALRRIRQAEKDKASYINRLQELLPLIFKDDSLTYSVIQSPADMVIEGDEMQHCVGGYYDKKDSLIMSCRDQHDKRVETIEVSLREYKVLQSRGKCNIHTKWHNQILSTMERNMDLIRKLDDQRRKRLKRKVRAAV
jgi:hypothetical protein